METEITVELKRHLGIRKQKKSSMISTIMMIIQKICPRKIKKKLERFLDYSHDDVPVEVLRILYPDDEFKTGTICGCSQGDWEHYIVKGDVDVERLEAYYFGNVVDIFVKDNEEEYGGVMTCDELWDAEREGYEKVFRERYEISEDEELKIYVVDRYIKTLDWKLVS